MDLTFKAEDIKIGFHNKGYRIDKTASPMDFYTKWEITAEGEWINPRPACFDSMPQDGWYKEEMKSKETGSGKKRCRWYDSTSGMKRAYDSGLLDKKWIDDYCMNRGIGCIRKKRFEGEGYVSPDYVLPDGTVDENLRRHIIG